MMKFLVLLAVAAGAMAGDPCVDEELQCAHYGTKACSSSLAWSGVKTTNLDDIECDNMAKLSDAFNSDQLFDGQNCGNPDASSVGPWCFIKGHPMPCFPPCKKVPPKSPKAATKPSRPMPKPVGLCVDRENECAHVGDLCASRYGFIGAKNTTWSGIECQNWADQVSDAFGSSEFGELNYCFNVDASPEGPWCYADVPGGRDFCFKPCDN